LKFSKWIRFIISGLAGITILILIIKLINVNKVFKALSGLNPVWLIPIVGLNLITPIFRAARWKILLNPIANINFRRLIGAVILGSLANMIAPIRTGEFLRSFLISAEENVKFISSLSSILVEKVIDVLTLFGIIIVTTVMLQIPLPTQFFNILKTAGILFLFLMVLIMLMVKKKNLAFKALKLTNCIFPKKFNERLFIEFEAAIKGMEALNKKPKTTILISFLSIILWGTPIFPIIILFKAFSIKTSIGIITLGYALHSLSFAIPAPPGYIGTFELYWALIYSSFGLNFEEALAIGLILHAISFLSLAILVSIAFLSIDFRKLIKV